MLFEIECLQVPSCLTPMKSIYRTNKQINNYLWILRYSSWLVICLLKWFHIFAIFPPMEHFICNISCNDTQNERTAIQLIFAFCLSDRLEQRHLLGSLGVMWVIGQDSSFEPTWLIYTQFNWYCFYQIPRIWKKMCHCYIGGSFWIIIIGLEIILPL